MAVLSVIVAHAGFAGVAGGFVGVDVFFVISGFLITAGLAREATRTGRVSILDFYARRARRILPGATVVLLVVVAASAVLYRSGNLAKVLGDVRAAALFGENIHLAGAETGYFATTSFVSPVLHFWSLAVEEQFYLVWPLLIGLTLLAVGGRGDATRRRLGLRVALGVVATLSVLSLAWSVHDTTHSALTAYYSTFTRAWELGLGALVALAAARIARTPRAVLAVISWVGVAMILTAILTYDDATPFPSYRALLPVAGSALVLAGGLAGSRFGAERLLGLAPMRFIGDISYSLYLWHWPLLILAPVWRDHPVSTRGRVALVLLAIGCAYLSYRFVEEPFRRRGGITRGRVRALTLWPVTVGLVLGVVVAGQYVWVTRPQAAAADIAERSGTETPAQLRQDVQAAADQAQDAADLPRTFEPALADLFDDVSRPAAGCGADAGPTRHKLCPVGDVTSSRTVVLLGDSHVGMWLKPLTELAKADGYRIVTFDKASCVPIDAVINYHGTRYTQCEKYGQWALGEIRALKPMRIIVSGIATTRLMDPTTNQVLSESDAADAFEKGARSRLTALRTITRDVRVISDLQSLPRDATSCLGSRSATRATCVVDQNRRVALMDGRWRAAAAATGARYVNLVPWFCASNLCPVVVGNTVVYRDADHITTTYAERLKPVLARQLRM